MTVLVVKGRVPDSIRNSIERAGKTVPGLSQFPASLLLLARLADLMEQHQEELATIEALDAGAVYTLALKTHVGMSIQTFRYFAGWCDKIQVGCGLPSPMCAFECVQAGSWGGDSKGGALPGMLPNSYRNGGLKHWQIKVLQVGVQQAWSASCQVSQGCQLASVRNT